jgi:hypothetical protein
MVNPLSQRDRRLCLLVVALLASAGTNATSYSSFFNSHSVGYAHIFPILSLYPSGAGSPMHPGLHPGVHPDTSVEVRADKAGVLITMPKGCNTDYRVRFFDGDNRFLFEVRQIRDAALIIEKVNFEHAGVFRYEIYRENRLLEKSNFVIRTE